MIKVEKLDVWGFEHAIRGMRNSMNSWDKSDSNFNRPDSPTGMWLGANDQKLMHKLYLAGPEQRKYLRQIFFVADVTAPLYWWKEADQYRVSVTTNSCSTMHKIHSKEFTLDDFSHEHLNAASQSYMDTLLYGLNKNRDLYLKTKKKDYWWQMIQLLPSSYNQKRTITMSYETVVTIIRQRTGHKLDEWNDFVAILRDLPYVRDIMEGEDGPNDRCVNE